MMKNWILIGMPASGKSTVGIVLAKTAGKQFVDTDLLMQEWEGMLLQDIIDCKGMKQFQETEATVLGTLDVQNAVIATGGSAIYYDVSMQHLRELGHIIYLQLPLPEIEKRLFNITTRGIAMQPGETLAGLYRQRVPLYEKYADITIACAGLNVERIVEEIIDRVPLSETAQ